jgi:anti-anti-sigma regulatory factor
MAMIKKSGVVELPPSPCAGAASVEAVAQALRRAGRASARVIVDLSRVRHIEGELLGLLVRAWKHLGARPGDMVLIVDELQREVFTATRLDRLFVLVASRTEAVSAEWPEPMPLIVTGRRLAA